MSLILFGVVAIAAYFDIRFRRIPNWLTYPAILIALQYFDNFYVVVFLLALLIALTFSKYIGAGDIKLSIAVALWSHILNLSQYWLYLALLFGGIAGLINRRKTLPFAPYIALGLLVSNVARGMGFI
jgi:prepilin signal peptidase PulO-like enzyme (type II secretory pathway)